MVHLTVLFCGQQHFCLRVAKILRSFFLYVLQVLVNGSVSRKSKVPGSSKMKAKLGPGTGTGILFNFILLAVFLAFIPGFCFGARSSSSIQLQTSSTSLSQHHNHNEGFEGHTRKVRRLQRLLLHNNRHTMQFRTEDEQSTELGNLHSYSNSIQILNQLSKEMKLLSLLIYIVWFITSQVSINEKYSIYKSLIYLSCFQTTFVS